MGNKAIDSEVMWYEVYRELAEQLKEVDGKKLYVHCLENEKFKDRFLEIQPWSKKILDNEKLSSLDPMHVFASINSSRMGEERRLKRIHLYFEILGINNSKEKYHHIDFTGCPSPVTIALMSARHKESQKEIWEVFKEIMNKKVQNNKDYFGLIDNWYGIAIESFTILLFWIDAKNFLPLDKNTVGLLKKYEKLIKVPKTWQEYNQLLINKESNLYINLAVASWKNVESLDTSAQDQVTNYLNPFNKEGIQLNLNTDFKLIAINLEKDYKALKKSLYTFDKAYEIENDKIQYKEENDVDFYSLDNMNINIIAIVGKNGTGKSSLLELLLKRLFFMRNQDKQNHEFPTIDVYIRAFNIYKMVLSNKGCEIYEFTVGSESYILNEEPLKDSTFTEDSFYNYLINYSIHGLNSKYGTNEWLDHVKDKSLISIEPSRTEGNIDVNLLNDELLHRIVCNVLEQEDEEYSFRELIKGNKANKLLSDKEYFEVKTGINFKGKKKGSYYEYDIEKLSNIINEFLIGNENLSIESIISKGFFFDIKLFTGIQLNDFSSGEKQKIYTVNSIVYALKNVNNKKIDFANIILDEIELYFHPEFQREYILNLIQAIEQVPTDYLLGINITFITHSPFILSDIPESKILFLDKEENIEAKNAKTISKVNNVKTFGANIHNLLNSSFFMENGLMGEFAKKKINEIISNLKNDSYDPSEHEKQEVYKIIDNIGEEFLREKILDMYYRKFKDDFLKENRKKALESEIKRMNEELKNL